MFDHVFCSVPELNYVFLFSRAFGVLDSDLRARGQFLALCVCRGGEDIVESVRFIWDAVAGASNESCDAAVNATALKTSTELARCITINMVYP